MVLPRYTRKARTGRARTARAPRTSRRAVDLTQLNVYYDGLSGFQVNLSGLEGYRTTYGEVMPEGIRALEALFQQWGPLARVPAGERAFADLGCGVGKVVLGMAMLRPEMRCRGFEIVPDRIEKARTALGRVKQRGLGERVSYTTTSFLDDAVSLRDVTWMYISNLCFDESTQEKLAAKLEAESPVGAVVICSKDMPFREGGRWKRVASGQRVPMSWASESTVNVYQAGAAAGAAGAEVVPVA